MQICGYKHFTGHVLKVTFDSFVIVISCETWYLFLNVYLKSKSFLEWIIFDF